MDSHYKRVMSPSLGLLTLAALTPPHHRIELHDENVSPVQWNDKPDLVGITVTVDTSPNAYRIAQRYRDKGVPVILGGIHASAMPNEALRYANSVCIGDADTLWPSILRDVENNRLKPIYRNKTNPDISFTPPPRLSLIDQRRYLYSNIVYTSKNCPYRCQFCYNSMDFRKSFRNRDMDSVLKEIDAKQTRHVLFIDDNFTGNPAWTRRFLPKLAERNIKWSAAVSADANRHEGLLELMKKSGCQSLFIGFESINENSLNQVNKRQNRTGEYNKLISQIHDLGIMINASIVFGFDHDKPDVFDATVDWLVQNKIETMTAHILTPYPGTRFYDKLIQEGRIIDHDKNNYNTANVVFQPRHMTPQQLYDGYLSGYRTFYSLGNIYRRIPEQSNQVIPFLLFNLCYRKYGKFFSRISNLGLMNLTGKIARKLSYNIS